MGVRLKDIAQRVGKSVTTVSRALNDYDDVSDETKAEITRLAEEMGYSPNTLAQRLQKRSSDTIGLIIPTSPARFEDPFFSELLAAVGDKASKLGYDLLVSTQPPGNQELLAYRKMLEGRQVDGFIVARTRRQDVRIEYLLAQEFPFVVFGCVEGEIDFPYVDVDGEYGMRLIADYLFESGCRSIACIAPDPQFSFALCRLKGLQDGLARHDLHIHAGDIKTGDLTQHSGYKNGRDLLSQPRPPDAIASCNDLMAFGAMRAAQELGLIVGKDVCVTGFDDVPMAEHSHPPLTTVHQPVHKIGGLICEMLIKRMSGEELEQEQIVLRPSLVIRQSCAVNFGKN
jgi:LacI family transcriptional regulator